LGNSDGYQKKGVAGGAIQIVVKTKGIGILGKRRGWLLPMAFAGIPFRASGEGELEQVKHGEW